MQPTNSSPYSVRLATSNDIQRLCELAAEFLGKLPEGLTANDARSVFQHVINDQSAGTVLVVEEKSAIRGYAYAAYEWRSEFGGETMEIVEIFVEQAWRNKGLGGSLIASLVQTARERNIHRISAQVHPGNAAIERILDSAGLDPEHRTTWGIRI